MISEVIIVGAGVAGLSCAEVLSGAGKQVRLLERSRGKRARAPRLALRLLEEVQG